MVSPSTTFETPLLEPPCLSPPRLPCTRPAQASPSPSTRQRVSTLISLSSMPTSACVASTKSSQPSTATAFTFANASSPPECRAATPTTVHRGKFARDTESTAGATCAKMLYNTMCACHLCCTVGSPPFPMYISTEKYGCCVSSGVLEVGCVYIHAYAPCLGCCVKMINGIGKREQRLLSL